MSQHLIHAIDPIVHCAKDAVGLAYSAVLQLFEGNVLNPHRLIRMVLKLLLAALLVVAPSVADVQYLSSSNSTRSYWIHSPGNLQGGQKYPVVILFHGRSGIGSGADGLVMQLDLKLSLPLVRTAYSSDKYFVYPNGVGGAWAGPSYAKVSVEEELQFVNDLIEDLKSKYNIDSNRIYAAGMSNGGGFTGTLACSEVGRQFAGFASVAGSFYDDIDGLDCVPSRSPLPILNIHGGEDKRIPYTGGKGLGGPLPPISAWLDMWADRNGCTSNSTTHSDDGNVHHISWTCGEHNGIFQHWKVDANGHTWPSKSRNLNMRLVGMGPQPIEANDIVMDFFDQFSLT